MPYAAPQQSGFDGGDRMARKLTADERLALFKDFRGPSETLQGWCNRVGISYNTGRSMMREVVDAGLISVLKNSGAPAPVVEPAPIEVHDRDFWRKRARAHEKEIGRMERVIEELGGIRNVPIQVPEWTVQRDGSAGQYRAVLGALVSDVHYGEVVDPDEILGVNAYDTVIAAERMKKYFYALTTIGIRWSTDCSIMGVLLTLAGDLISGDIHEELRITNALTAHDQVKGIVEILEAGIYMLLGVYPAVHVVGVPGNHGRTTHKPTAKLYAALSYDILVCSMLADRFKGDPRVTFQFGRSKDQLTPIFKRTVLSTHFDKIGTKGGMGFAGPMLPIIRGSKKVIEQQGSVDRYPDLIQGGHYHSTGNPYLGRVPILANGSVIGINEYGDDIRAAVEHPQQWAYLLHERWWLRERQPIILTDLKAPEKPRVKVPASMA